MPAATLLRQTPFPTSSFNMEFDILNRGVFVIWQLTVRVILKLVCRLEVSGRENIPPHGSYILVSNHSSHLDTLCLLGLVPLSRISETYAAAAEDHFFINRWKANIVNRLFHAVPFCRIKTRETHQSLRLCKQLLSTSDRTLIFFPEGQRSRDGVLQPFKRGIGYLLASTHVNVIPVYIQGAHDAWPKGNIFPKPGKLLAVIGRPLNFSNAVRTSRSYSSIAQIIEQQLKTLIKSNTLCGEYCEKST